MTVVDTTELLVAFFAVYIVIIVLALRFRLLTGRRSKREEKKEYLQIL